MLRVASTAQLGFVYIDSPATTSPVTYVFSGSASGNVVYAPGANGTPLVMIAEEVGP